MDVFYLVFEAHGRPPLPLQVAVKQYSMAKLQQDKVLALGVKREVAMFHKIEHPGA